MQADGSKSDKGGSRVHNEEEDPTRGRKRVSRACVRCRLKKDRCDGLRPSCSSCNAADQSCSYESTTKKRGLPEGYVRGLEKLWAILIDKVDGIEDVVIQVTNRHHEELLEVWNHEVIGEDLHTKWKDSKVLSELEGLLSNLEKDPQTGSKRKRGKDENTPESPSARDIDTSFLRKVEYEVVDFSGPRSAPLQTIVALRDLEPPRLDLVFPHNATKLLDHYFTFTHCWFPILDRPQILRRFYEYSKRQGAIETPSSDLAVLWAIFSYTSLQRQCLTERSTDLDTAQSPNLATQMQAMARSLLPEERAPWNMGHVQALLLLILIEVGLNQWDSAWILSGTATRLALTLSLGTGSAGKRGLTVHQGCFILDTLTASHLLHPPHLRRSDVRSFAHSEEDGHEEWEPWNPSKGESADNHEPAFIISSFNRLFDVFMILNDVITCEADSGDARMAYFQGRYEVLQSLQDQFPVPSSSSVHAPPHQVYLRLFHRAALISILKQFFDRGTSPTQLAQLACDILVALTEYGQKSSFGLQEIPPALENPIRAACYAAIASKPVFGSTPGLPPYLTFARKMAEHISQISRTWPVYSSLSTIWKSALENDPTFQQTASASVDAVPNNGALKGRFPFLQPGTFETSFPSANWSSRQLMSPTGQNGIRDKLHMQPVNWLDPGSAGSSQAMKALPPLPPARNPSLTELEQSHKSGSIHTVFDTQMTGFETPAGLTMPTVESSPSFHGDDLDAIFHNLAQLDTTEWTGNWEQGLRDFGFADDLTFQAFCNDPERLVAPSAPFGQPPTDIENLWPPETLQSSPGSDARPTLGPERVGWWG